MQLKKRLDDCELRVETEDQVVVLRINRPQKRNAINDVLMERLGAFFQRPPPGIRAIVLTAAGENFSSGLDLAEHRERDAQAVMLHSQMWHRVLDSMESSGLPVVSVLKGAVIGGGLEIATATHVRVAEQGTFYALPEAIRGIYVGGGASVRIAGLIGRGRMIEMMLTGRTFSTEEGQSLGISHYIVDRGQGEPFALELARRIARNAPLSNYAILNAIPRIAEMSPRAGLFAESLMAAVVHTADDAKAGLSEFLEKKAPRLRAALASEASGQRGHSISARAGHSPEAGSSARAALASEASGQRGYSTSARAIARRKTRVNALVHSPEAGSSARDALATDARAQSSVEDDEHA